MAEPIFSVADKIIQILKERKRIELKELIRLAGINETDLRKILELLEAEGLIGYDYNLTRIIVSWKRSEKEGEVPISAVQETKEKGAYEETFVREVKKGKKKGKEKKVKGKTKITKTPKSKKRVVDKEAVRTKAVMEPLPFPVEVQSHRAVAHRAAPEPTPREIQEAQEAAEAARMREESIILTQQLRAKMDDVQRQRKIVEDLKRRKAQVADEYGVISRKTEAELEVIGDIVTGKERKIKALKERLKSIPEKVGATEVDTLRLRDAEIGVKQKFGEVMEGLEATSAQIKEFQKNVGSEIGKSQEELVKQVEELESLMESLKKLDRGEEEIERGVQRARSKVEREIRVVEALENQLEGMKQTRVETAERIKEMQNGIENDVIKLDNLEGEIEKVQELEKAIARCKREYNSEIKELEKEIAENEKELASVREIVEAGVARKYLKELEKLKEEHEEEITTLAAKEDEINNQLENAKTNFKRKVKEAQEISDKLYSKLPKYKTKGVAEITEDLKNKEESDRSEADGKRQEKRKKRLGELSNLLSKLRGKKA